MKKWYTFLFRIHRVANSHCGRIGVQQDEHQRTLAFRLVVSLLVEVGLVSHVGPSILLSELIVDSLPKICCRVVIGGSIALEDVVDGVVMHHDVHTAVLSRVVQHVYSLVGEVRV